MFKSVVGLGAFVAFALSFMAGGSGTAAANPFFAKQTGMDCSGCHIPGRENDGPNGLNPTGQAFKNCNFSFGCGGGNSNTTQSQSGMAKFEDQCSNGNYFAVRWGGDPNATIRFMLKNGHKVHIEVPQGSTYAGACGGWPSNGGRYDFINLE